MKYFFPGPQPPFFYPMCQDTAYHVVIILPMERFHFSLFTAQFPIGETFLFLSEPFLKAGCSNNQSLDRMSMPSPTYGY